AHPFFTIISRAMIPRAVLFKEIVCNKQNEVLCMIINIRKRNGAVVDFKPYWITRSILKAANAVDGNEWALAAGLTDKVEAIAERQYGDDIADVEGIQDIVEKVLIENGHAKTAKAYILYREKRWGAREANALIGATIEMFSNYLGENDWRIKE